MQLRLLVQNMAALRIGIQSLKSGEFICPKDKYCYVTDYGSFFYLKNNETVDIPDDEYAVFAAAGIRFEPIRREIRSSDDNIIDLEINPIPFPEFRNSNWYDADLHIHALKQNNSLSPAVSAGSIPVEIEAEQISFSSIVDRNGETIPYAEKRELIQATEYRSGTYGHYLLLGEHLTVKHHREHYSPEKPYPLPMQLFNRSKQEGSTIICAHPIPQCAFDDRSSWPGGGYARGILPLLAAGLVDALSITESSGDREQSKRLWYHLLNMGIKIPAAAGGDICLHTQSQVPPVGTWRTIAAMSDGTGFEQFLAQVRRGRTFISTGPVLTMDIDGYLPGDSLPETTGTRTLHIELRHSPEVINTLQIIVDGGIFSKFHINSKQWSLQMQIPCSQGAWVAVECFGAASWYYPQGLWAHTNPIYLTGNVDEPALSKSSEYVRSFVTKLDDCLCRRGLSENERREVTELSLRRRAVHPDQTTPKGS